MVEGLVGGRDQESEAWSPKFPVVISSPASPPGGIPPLPCPLPGAHPPKEMDPGSAGPHPHHQTLLLVPAKNRATQGCGPPARTKTLRRGDWKFQVARSTRVTARNWEAEAGERHVNQQTGGGRSGAIKCGGKNRVSAILNPTTRAVQSIESDAYATLWSMGISLHLAGIIPKPVQ